MEILIAKTVDEVLAKYEEAAQISPVYERVMVFSWNDMLKLKTEIDRLREAIKNVIENNLHLADGDTCTLIDLKRAINYDK